MTMFIQPQKQKYLSMKVTLMMCFNQFILSYKKHRKIFRKRYKTDY